MKKSAGRKKKRYFENDDPRILHAIENATRVDWPAEARKALSSETFFRMTSKQLEGLCLKMMVLRAWDSFKARAKIPHRGYAEHARAAFVFAAKQRFGRGTSERSLTRWLRASRAGVAGLVGAKQGRPAGSRPIDSLIWSEYVALVRTGTSKRLAWRRCAARAGREGRYWPSLKTIQRTIQVGHLATLDDGGTCE